MAREKDALDSIPIRLDQLSRIVAICRRLVRKAGKIDVSSVRMHYAHSLFQKAYLHGRSIQALIAQARRTEQIDIAGLCSVGRLIIEAHNVFGYLAEPNIGEPERAMRFQLMYLNDAVDLVRMNTAFGIKARDDRVHFHEYFLSHAKSELRQNPRFCALPPKQQEHLLKGKTPYLSDRYKGSRPLPRAIESAVYNLFSHNVHSFGLSHRYGGQWTPAGARNCIFLAIEISGLYLAHLLRMYRAIRPRSIGQFTDKESRTIEDALSAGHLNNWMRLLSDLKGR